MPRGASSGPAERGAVFWGNLFGDDLMDLLMRRYIRYIMIYPTFMVILFVSYTIYIGSFN